MLTMYVSFETVCAYTRGTCEPPQNRKIVYCLELHLLYIYNTQAEEALIQVKCKEQYTHQFSEIEILSLDSGSLYLRHFIYNIEHD